MSIMRYDALQRRRYELQNIIYRNAEIIKNGNWRENSNELDALQKQNDYATSELAELDMLLDEHGHTPSGALPITWNQLLTLFTILVLSGVILVALIFTLGGR